VDCFLLLSTNYLLIYVSLEFNLAKIALSYFETNYIAEKRFELKKYIPVIAMCFSLSRASLQMN